MDKTDYIERRIEEIKIKIYQLSRHKKYLEELIKDVKRNTRNKDTK